MRRSKQPAAEPTVFAPAVARAAEVSARPAPRGMASPAEFDRDDLDRGRTAALIATLGRVQLTLDLIERRLGRVEESIFDIRAALFDEALTGEALTGEAPTDPGDDDYTGTDEVAEGGPDEAAGRGEVGDDRPDEAADAGLDGAADAGLDEGAGSEGGEVARAAAGT